MFTTLFSVSLFIALIRSVIAWSGLQIDTPSFVQCQPTQITWSYSNNLPYDLLIVSAQDVCGEALEDLGNQTSTAMTWIVNLPGGSEVVLSLEDSVGNEAWSGNITVGNSNDTSCLDSTPSAAPSASTPAISGTPLTVPPSGGATTTHSSSPTSSAFTSASAASAGLSPTSSALSTCPLGAVTLFSSAVLVVVAFAL